MIKYILIFFLLIVSKKLFSQKDTLEISIKNRAKEVVEAWKKNHRIWEYNRFFLDNYKLSYNYFKKFENDSSERALQVVVSKYFMLAVDNQDKNFRRKIVEDLLSIAVKHVSLKNDYDPFSILSTLLIINNGFKVDDFTKSSKKKITLLFKEKTSYSSVLLVGFVGLKDQILELKKFLPEGEYYKKPGKFYFSSLEWAARIAMARLGDKEQINFCVTKISKMDIITNPYDTAKYFDYLEYIHQPEVLPYLFSVLEENIDFPSTSISTSGTYAAGTLYNLLEGFPHNPNTIRYEGKKGVEELTKWIHENKGKYKFKE